MKKNILYYKNDNDSDEPDGPDVPPVKKGQ